MPYAANDPTLPITFETVFDVLTTPASVGFVGRRKRWNEPKPIRLFRITYDSLPKSEMLLLDAVLIAALGATLIVPLIIPDVGLVNVRIDDDGWEFVEQGAERYSSQINLIEERRVA